MKTLLFIGIFPLVLLLSACASSPQGQKVDAYQWADIGTTAIGLSGGATEANPLALYLLPVKIYAGSWVDKLPCKQRRSVASGLNGVIGMAIINNLAGIAGLVNPIIWGLAGGGILWYVDDPGSCEE